MPLYRCLLLANDNRVPLVLIHSAQYTTAPPSTAVVYIPSQSAIGLSPSVRPERIVHRVDHKGVLRPAGHRNQCSRHSPVISSSSRTPEFSHRNADSVWAAQQRTVQQRGDSTRLRATCHSSGLLVRNRCRHRSKTRASAFNTCQLDRLNSCTSTLVNHDAGGVYDEVSLWRVTIGPFFS
jgi:hypothetical protein